MKDTNEKVKVQGGEKGCETDKKGDERWLHTTRKRMLGEKI